jgi:hypothetical protein
MNKDNEHGINYTIFPKEITDHKIQKIIQDCHGLTEFTEIIKIIDTTLYNRLSFSIPFDSKSAPLYLYRITQAYPDFDENISKCYSYPNISKENGRAHIVGSPVFYCSLDPSTALKEMKENLKVGETFYLSQWVVEFNETVLAQSLLANTSTDKGTSPISSIVKSQYEQSKEMFTKVPDNIADWFHYASLKIGDLFTLPGKENYHITSSFAHDILYESRKQNINVSMLAYPSVVTNHNGINFAIHPNLVNSSMMQLQKILKLEVQKIEEDGIKVSMSMKGIEKNKNIKWQKPAILLQNVKYEDIQIWTTNNFTFTGQAALSMSINKSTWSVEAYIKREINKHLLSCLVEYECSQNDKNPDFEPSDRKMEFLMESISGCLIDTPEGPSDIKYMKVPVFYRNEYKQI